MVTLDHTVYKILANEIIRWNIRLSGLGVNNAQVYVSF